MKSAQLTYHRAFPWSPISGWAGAREYGWVQRPNASGQPRLPETIYHPFPWQRLLWCRLAVHFQGVDLLFAMPLELDQFIAVMGANPLPSGRSLLPEQRRGRPNNHWLSRLPAKAKTWKFRQAVCRYLETSPEVRRFRAFYEAKPPRLEFKGVFNSYGEALGSFRSAAELRAASRRNRAGSSAA